MTGASPVTTIDGLAWLAPVMLSTPCILLTAISTILFLMRMGLPPTPMTHSPFQAIPKARHSYPLDAGK